MNESTIKADLHQNKLKPKNKSKANLTKLINLRIIQKQLIYVIGLSYELANVEDLAEINYFGKYGRVLKLIVNRTKAYNENGPNGPSYSVHVTYSTEQEASIAILALDNSVIAKHTIKASYGTTKYCSNFIKHQECTNKECLFYHSLADESDVIEREVMNNKSVFHQMQLIAIRKGDVYNPSVKRRLLSVSEGSKKHSLFPAADTIYKRDIVVENDPKNFSINKFNSSGGKGMTVSKETTKRNNLINISDLSSNHIYPKELEGNNDIRLLNSNNTNMFSGNFCNQKCYPSNNNFNSGNNISHVKTNSNIFNNNVNNLSCFNSTGSNGNNMNKFNSTSINSFNYSNAFSNLNNSNMCNLRNNNNNFDFIIPSEIPESGNLFKFNSSSSNNNKIDFKDHYVRDKKYDYFAPTVNNSNTFLENNNNSSNNNVGIALQFNSLNHTKHPTKTTFPDEHLLKQFNATSINSKNTNCFSSSSSGVTIKKTTSQDRENSRFEFANSLDFEHENSSFNSHKQNSIEFPNFVIDLLNDSFSKYSFYKRKSRVNSDFDMFSSDKDRSWEDFMLKSSQYTTETELDSVFVRK